MKRYFAFLLLGLAAIPALGQEMADYYQLPDQRHQYDRLLTRYGGAYIQNRWYVSLSGFGRTDRAKLDNSFNDLLTNSSVTKPGWSALVGWSYRERWAIEAGYANSAIHTDVLVNGSPYSFQFTNDKQSFFLRAKHMILSTSGPWRRSGFWLTGGMWAVPNSGQDKGQFSLVGYNSYDWRRENPIRLSGHTALNNQPTAMIETGLEYNVRLNDRFDMGFSVRKLWGMGSSVTTDVAYMVNGRETQQAQLRGTGSGITYGATLSYTFALQRKINKVLQIQGKQRIK